MAGHRTILPLHYYDEEGRLKASRWMYASLLFLMRGYLVAIASLTYRQDTGLLLSLFYPDRHYFYLSLATGLPAMLLLVVVWWRHKFRQWAPWLFACFRPLLQMSLVADLLLHLWMGQHQHWQFSWLIALTLLLDLLLLLYWRRSGKQRQILKDWGRE
ncbi:DUF2919 family protein [Bowmanella dokdonensis]|uniref:DUF2919 domain-containing protein n=1 Tax=Bowmanella dokdonensis TaxID=751969 RepID=A0A939ITM4_9ALTE|nr:DUF2919 family protein [Bowmanella dokdonensis]MBN7827611.1 DUF2919 domain-containing protein [Bowmanella dokdonensis]